MHNYHQCITQLFALPPPPREGRIFCCYVGNSYYMVDEFLALFGPKGIYILQRDIPFSPSDVTISHPQSRTTEPKKPRVKTLPRDEIPKTEWLLLICNENLFTNNEDPFASVCVFVLAQGAGPPTVLCCTNCVLQSEMSHMLCIRNRRGKKEVLPSPDWVNLVLLLAISPVKKETHQKQAFQPKL